MLTLISLRHLNYALSIMRQVIRQNKRKKSLYLRFETSLEIIS